MKPQKQMRDDDLFLRLLPGVCTTSCVRLNSFSISTEDFSKTDRFHIDPVENRIFAYFLNDQPFVLILFKCFLIKSI